MLRIAYCCGECGSENITCDAVAAWSVEDQRWELAGVQDQEYCGDCDGETRLIMRDADTGEEIAYAPNGAGIVTKAEADSLWQIERDRYREIRAAEEAERAALEAAAANARALASWQGAGQ